MSTTKPKKKVMRQAIESGCPDGMQYVHPVMLRNFGQWVNHTHPAPGVLCHIAASGEAIWTVRAGTQRILDVFTLRKLCDIGDEYADGHVRFTIRSNIEYMVDSEAKVQPLIKAPRCPIEFISPPRAVRLTVADKAISPSIFNTPNLLKSITI